MPTPNHQDPTKSLREQWQKCCQCQYGTWWPEEPYFKDGMWVAPMFKCMLEGELCLYDEKK